MKEWDEEYGKIISDMFGGLDNYLKVKLKLRRPMINQIIEHAGKEKPIRLVRQSIIYSVFQN